MVFCLDSGLKNDFHVKDLGDKFGKFDYRLLLNDISGLLLTLLSIIMVVCLLKAASLYLGDAC